MTVTEMTNLVQLFLQSLQLISVVGAAAFLLLRLGKMAGKFEAIGVQQSSEIAELKTGMAKVEGVLVTLASQSGRIDRIEDRVQMQGHRIDEALSRFNSLIDAKLAG